MVVDVFVEGVDVGGEGEDCSSHLQVVLAVAEVVGGDLDAKVGHWIKALLRQENCTYTLGPFQVAKLKGNELLEAVEIAIDSSVVPPR